MLHDSYEGKNAHTYVYVCKGSKYDDIGTRVMDYL